MRYLILLAALLTGMRCFGQGPDLDSLTKDSLLRVGYERCAAILSHDFDTCIYYEHESYSEDWVLCNERGGDSITGWGVHQGCCDHSGKTIYDEGQVIGRIKKSSEPGKRENTVTYYVGIYEIVATWNNEYALSELHITGVYLSGIWILPMTLPGSTERVTVKPQ